MVGGPGRTFPTSKLPTPKHRARGFYTDGEGTPSWPLWAAERRSDASYATNTTKKSESVHETT